MTSRNSDVLDFTFAPFMYRGNTDIFLCALFPFHSDTFGLTTPPMVGPPFSPFSVRPLSFLRHFAIYWGGFHATLSPSTRTRRLAGMSSSLTVLIILLHFAPSNQFCVGLIRTPVFSSAQKSQQRVKMSLLDVSAPLIPNFVDV
jgi:hypothetical protein